MPATAVIVGHPGHELRIYGWIKRERPAVHVLTDGSGRSGTPRLAATERVIAAAGATPGSNFGVFSDASIHAAILARDATPFLDLARRLGAELVRDDVRAVAADPIEGYNPTHDLCRAVVDAAARSARRRGWNGRMYCFPLMGLPDSGPPNPERLRVDLDDSTHAEKVALADAYHELQAEVAAVRAVLGIDAFRVEWLDPVDIDAPQTPPEMPPFYESYGEYLAQTGVYGEVIRFADHVMPIVEALRDA